MRVEIKDRETLSGVAPGLATLYLRANGWARTRLEPDRFSIWSRGPNSGEVLVPLNRHLDDFAERIAELLADLQRIEGRSEFEILRDIDATGSDVYRFRNQPFTPLRGTIPIEDGVRLVEYVRDILLYGATSERDPNRPTAAGRWSDEVAQFMRQALLGQTEIGSFVVTAQIPVPAPIGPDLFPERIPPATEPFERRAGIRVMSLLADTRAAGVRAEATGSLDGFRDLVRGGALQVMGAIVGAQEISPTMPLEVRCAWAPSRPVIGPEPPKLVSFEPEIIVPIRHVFASARTAAPILNAQLVGTVQRLERTPQEPLIGDLVITTTFRNRTLKVHFSLEQPLYNEAIDAFKRDSLVGVTGELEKVGKFWVLKNVRDLRIFERDEEPDEA